VKYFSLLISILCTTFSQAQFKDTQKLENFDYLNDVVISTNKGFTKIKESTVGLSILKPYLIENKITTNISTALSQVPGVAINDDQINIRSGSGWSYGAGSRVMVCIDDMPMLTGDAGAVPFSFLPTEGIQSVEVIKNAGSVLYGSSAVNGVINMRSAPITEKPEGQMSMIGGVYDIPLAYQFSNKRRYLYGLHGFYREKIGQHSFSVNWNQLNDDSYRMGDYDYRVRMGWRYGYQPKRFPKLKLWLNGNIQRGESASFLLWQSDKQPYTALDNAVTKNTGRRFYVDPILEWNGTWKHTFQNRYFQVKNDIDNGNPNNNQDNQSAFYYSEWRSSRVFQNKWNFTGGLVNSYTLTESPLFQGNHQARNHSAYSQLSYKNSGWVLEGGARYEYFVLDEKVRSKPVFRAGINKQVGKATFLRASYGEGFRFPSMAELFTVTSTGNISVFANPDLEPETSQNMEIGIKQGFQKKTKNYQIQSYVDVSIFRLNVQNLMEYTFYNWDPNGGLDGFGFKSLNVNPAQINGFEIESGGDLKSGSHAFRWFLGYTFSLPKVKDENALIAGINLPYYLLSSDPTAFMKYRNRHIIRTDVEYHLKNIVFGVSYRYESGFENIDRAFTEPGFINGLDIQYRSGKIDGHIFDLRAGMPLNDAVDIMVQVRNVTQQIFMGRPANMSAPRLFQFQLNYKF
jgi:outer membrane receptor for ferrienterochelin and colicins